MGEYLWDKTGDPEADVERLEELLGRYRLAEPAPLLLPEQGGRRLSAARRAAAFVLVAAAAVVLFFFVGPPAEKRPQYRIDADLPAYDVSGIAGRDKLRVGEELDVAGAAAATVRIASHGEVALQPGSRLRVVEVSDALHRLYLSRGELSARIYAPPRLFQVGTPAGRAVDLGCEYVLRVAEDRSSHLSVTSGQVSFEFDGREVYVPAGATCVSVPRRGPGVPVFDDADEDFKRAVERVQFAERPDPADLRRVLDVDRRDDALSLWHLLDAPSEELRAGVLEVLGRIFPKPAGVTEAGVFAGDREMLRKWADQEMKKHWRRGGSTKKLELPVEVQGPGKF